MPSKDSKEEKKEKAREVVDILEEISVRELISLGDVSFSGLTRLTYWLTKRTLTWIGHNYRYAFR